MLLLVAVLTPGMAMLLVLQCRILGALTLRRGRLSILTAISLVAYDTFRFLLYHGPILRARGTVCFLHMILNRVGKQADRSSWILLIPRIMLISWIMLLPPDSVLTVLTVLIFLVLAYVDGILRALELVLSTNRGHRPACDGRNVVVKGLR